jgi:hypothetical protein
LRITKVNEMIRRRKMFCFRNLISVLVYLLAAVPAVFGATVVSSGQTIAFNTTAVTYSIDAGSAVNGVVDNGSARFDFDGLDIQSGATVAVTGTRPLLIVSNGNIIVNTLIDVSGQNGWVTSGILYGGGAGGPGGFAGGGKRTIGSGPGGGGTSTLYGAGGGGYGGAGGASSRVYRGSSDGGNGLGGIAYGDSHVYVLQGGSGGGGGKNASGGGGGGGAIALAATSGNITIGSSGAITCNGGDGVFLTYDPVEMRYGGGGGAGGAIRMDAGHGIVTINGSLSVKGGHGSGSQWMPSRTDYREYHSGGGGGGRIAVYSASGTYAGSATVTGAGGALKSTIQSFRGRPVMQARHHGMSISGQVPQACCFWLTWWPRLPLPANLPSIRNTSGGWTSITPMAR